ncbi:hypothetical protein [Mesorhizobium sp. M7A.F.Ca.CA.002.09.1.1]|uniref:hypothetical protein n=1 Tax=Mesorhizobium sp. M7A.F.Ca.CA.002.09.1.1 TaxID=2496739 RepID=UPI001FDEB446|nr:hypothetical protein [Mesorhizobium sp. M7A.F.Ca.CA.002.09.1.1]
MGGEDIGGGGQRLFAIPVSADHHHDFELAFDGLPEALDAGVGADIADDAGDQRDLRSRSLSLLASEVVSRVQFYANWLLFAGMQLKGHQLRCRSALWQQ